MARFIAAVRWVVAFVVAVLALFFTLLFRPAKAAPQCDAFDRVATLLTDQYGEVQLGGGIAGEAALMQLWVHPDGSSWSIIMILPDGRACLMASGSAWETVAATPAGSET